MARITLLPPDVANQIAAGEVVERPASIVKELVENALDAGAESITLTVDGGGLARIAVTDDGSGMDREDLALAILRHATSKIRKAEDLIGVGTYGFRGEALPSIASVARLKITSRAKGSDEGAEASVEGGSEATLRPAGCAVGTTVSVEDLFFNTPARRKFMRSPQTEGAACVEALVRLAIPRPDVRFSVRRDGKVVREFLRNQEVAARVREIWPDETLAELKGSRNGVTVNAFLGAPESARAGTNHLALYVNGRHVRDRMLLRAVSQSYGSTLESGRYPVGAVLVELPPVDVDVNAHPQKSEVRFAAQGAVFEAVSSVLRKAAAAAPWAQTVTTQTVSESPVATPVPVHAFVSPVSDTADPWTRLVPPPYPPVAYDTAGRQGFAPSPSREPSTPVASEPQPPDTTPSGAFGSLRYVAQLRRMYLICEGESGMVILDQHAAAERVTFDRLKRAYAARSVPMQPMLVPEKIELPAGDVALVEERSAELLAVGIDITPLGPTTVAVRGVPAMLKRADPRRLARDLVAELGREGGDFSKAVDLVLATMACHGSVRAGDVLADDEARALLTALDAVDFAGHCPHGRPVVWSMRWAELERKVGR